MEAEYFKDIDTDTVYACVGPMALNALFRLSTPLANDAAWEFLVPDSPTWDAVHQRIYRNPRVEKMTPEELPACLPPLPELPSGPFPDWREHFLPQQPIHASQYPSVTKLLKARNDGMATLYVVLYEDRYETLLGDGEFHYLRDVFLTSEDAQNYINRNRNEGGQFHLRTMSINLDYDKFVFPDFQPERYDHHKVEEVLNALEARLRD